jgi:AcrR family transcriptional regulator
MGRWQPHARGRLEKAAMDLYRERGFDRTTVAHIAARAGLTERTFFRYFADKREVLFSGSDALQTLMVDAIAEAPPGATPLEMVAAALEATASVLEPRRDFARQRNALISTHADLQEREVMKLNSLAAALAEALRGRDVLEPGASLAAEAGIAVFKVAFERWIEATPRRDLVHHIRAALAELKAITAGKQLPAPRLRARSRALFAGDAKARRRGPTPRR